jgi:hypothetical protein
MLKNSDIWRSHEDFIVEVNYHYFMEDQSKISKTVLCKNTENR